MGDNMVYTLSVDKKTGQLAVQQKQLPSRYEDANPVHELRRVMDQQHNARKFTLIFLLCLAILFPVLLFFNINGYFVLAITILSVILSAVYLISYHYDHKTIAHTVDAYKKIAQTKNRVVIEPEQNYANDPTDERSETNVKYRK